MKSWSVAGAIELVVLSAWLGAAVIVATTVAPAAFAVLPTRSLAGALVGEVLPVIFIAGIVVAVVAALCEMQVGRGAFRLRLTAPLVALATSCIIAQFMIGPRIARIRDAVAGPIDSLSITDPRRAQFGSLHGFSVMWLGVAMLGAAVAIAMQVDSLRRSNTSIYSPTGQRVG